MPVPSSWRRAVAEGKQSIRVPRKVWLAIAVVILGLALAAQNSTVLFPEMGSYTLIDERTIALQVFVAPCSWTRVTDVTETSTEVRVKVETLPCPLPGPQTGALRVRYLIVSLATDLGSRLVEDANGQTITLRARCQAELP